MQSLTKVLGGVFAWLVFLEALACAAAAVLGHGGRWSLRLDVLNHFAPFWLAGGMAALAFAILRPSDQLRTASMVISGIAIVASAGLILPEYLRPFSPKAPADAPYQVKIIQFNAWGYVNAEVDTGWLTAQDPDIIVMQEATPAVVDQILATGRYHMTFDEGTVPIFSKRPALTGHITRPKRWWPWAPMSRASFPAPGGAYDVVSVHYTWPTTPTQEAQGRIFAETLKQFPKERLIIAGDFNSTPWSFARRREDAMFGVERRTRALFSWPATQVRPLPFRPPIPILPIDHIYAGSDWRTVKIERGPDIGSDHYPVIITLALDTKRTAPRATPGD